MKALITGVTGFIGRELASLLLKEGWEVTGTSRHSDTIHGIQWQPWDAMSNPDPSLFNGVDVIFHLAGKAHAVAESRQTEAEYDAINYGGTERLLHAAHDHHIRRFVYFSSVKAVGDVEGVMDTSVERMADTPYGLSKRKSEQLLLTSGLVAEPVIIRPTMVYGPTHKGNLPRMIRAIQQGWFPPLPDTGSRRSMVDVRDVAAAALLLASHPEASHHTYIVSDGTDYSIRQIHQWICAALQRPAPSWSIPLPVLQLVAAIGDGIAFLNGRRCPLDSIALDKLIGDARYDSQPLHRLGFRAHHTLQSTIPEMVQFMLTKQGVS